MSEKAFPEIIADSEAHQPFQQDPPDELKKLWQINRELGAFSDALHVPHTLAIVKIMQCTVCGTKVEVRKAADYYYIDRSAVTPEGWYSPCVCGACKEEYCAASLQLQKAKADTKSLLDKVYQSVKTKFIEWLSENGYNRRAGYFAKQTGKRQLILRLTCDCGKSHDFVSDDMSRTPVASDGWASTRYGTMCLDCFAQEKRDYDQLDTFYKEGSRARKDKLAELYWSTPVEKVDPSTIEIPQITHWEGYRRYYQGWGKR